jgi:hypothetical protein
VHESAVGLYLAANSSVFIEKLKMLTLDADRNVAGSPSINDMSISHAICTLHPDVPCLHAVVSVVISLDW